ncbi:23S rRNA (guanine(745)-N(1))-methyltransferase [Thalassotalea euphylliae]
MTAQYICPICQDNLVQETHRFVCNQNHSFDIAKENYVNLLPVQFKRSKNPGDNKAMVNARREFLEKGFYKPLVDRLLTLYTTYGDNSTTMLDAGCGEGYYTHQHKTNTNTVYGVDIAKEAIKKAGKKYKECHFSVGTLSKLPFSEGMFDWIVSIYAPILEQEFTRVLKPGGYLITVTPAKQHLSELKQAIYRDALEHDEEREPIENLRAVHEEKLSYEMLLADGQDVLNLLSMTPFAFKASEETKQQLKLSTVFPCRADFLIKLYQRPI